MNKLVAGLSPKASDEFDLIVSATSAEQDTELYKLVCEGIKTSHDKGVNFIKAFRKRFGLSTFSSASEAQISATFQLFDFTVRHGPQDWRRSAIDVGLLKDIADMAMKTGIQTRNQILIALLYWSENYKNDNHAFVEVKLFLEREYGVVFHKKPNPAQHVHDFQAQPNALDSEYISKLKVNLELVVDFIFMTRDMLSNIGEGEDGSQEILKGLIANLKESQNRLMILLCEIEVENLVAIFIKLNDLIQETLEFNQAVDSGIKLNDIPKFKPSNRVKLSSLIKSLRIDEPLNMEDLELEIQERKTNDEKKKVVDIQDEKDFEEIANRDQKNNKSQSNDPLAFLSESFAEKEKSDRPKVANPFENL